jgi:hypothetical protein
MMKQEIANAPDGMQNNNQSMGNIWPQDPCNALDSESLFSSRPTMHYQSSLESVL